MGEIDDVVERNDDLARELAGVTEMLGHVLAKVGEAVRVEKEEFKQGLPGQQIQIDEDDEGFTFYLSEVK